jgi:hypothetical protein
VLVLQPCTTIPNLKVLKVQLYLFLPETLEYSNFLKQVLYHWSHALATWLYSTSKETLTWRISITHWFTGSERNYLQC